MDTSETYIKMCEKAWQLLKPNIPIGELLFSRRLRMLYVVDSKVGHWGEIVNTSNSDRAFPLLEQDQLQEMIEFEDMVVINHHRNPDFFMMSYRKCLHIESVNARTMEQLWLAFVMKEKYGKVWNGEDWTVITEEA